AYDDVRDGLVNALQLHRGTAGSEALSQAGASQFFAAAEPKDFSVIIDRQRLRRALLFLLPTIVLATALPAVWPSTLGAAWERLVRHDESFLPPPPYALHLRTDASTVMRGTTVHVTVTAKGTAPQTITVWVRDAASDRFQPFTVRMDSANTYKHILPGLTASVACYAEGAWLETGVRTDTTYVTVTDRPLIRTLAGRVMPPSYAGLAPTPLTLTQADITTLTGSTVDLSITSNKNLAKATILIMGTDTTSADTTTIAMQVKGAMASGRFTVQRSGQYMVRITDARGEQNADPVAYRIIAFDDGAPTIAMIEPTRDAEVDQRAILPLTVAIADDYGFAWLRLHYRLVKSRYAQPETNYTSVDIPFSAGGTSADIDYVWNLGKAGISPEDVYEFYVEVADNDRVRGPKTARTTTMTVRLPSLDEVFAETDKAHDDISKELREVAREAEEVRKEAEQVQRELAKQQSQPQTKQQADWKEKKQAQELAAKQEALQKRMEQMQQKMEDMTQKLQQNQAISQETLEKYMELQKLMQEVNSPELKRMQEEQKKAMEQMSPEELREAMKNMTFDEEQFKKSIERTLNLLKRIQAEQKADELQKRAEDLAQRQEELRQQAQNTNPQNKQARDEIAKQQQELQKDLDKLAKETDDLDKLMKELGDMPMDKMDAAKRELDKQNTQQQMQKAEQNAEQGDMQEAADAQQKASQNLQRFAQQMKDLKRDLKRRGAKEAMRQMQRSMNDMLDLSKQQEELRDQANALDPSSSQFPELARKQQRTREAMQNLANSMMQLAQKSFSVSPEMAEDMGNALQGMQEAMQNLQERRGQQAGQGMQKAMSSMNSAAQKMSQALGQMMAGEGEKQGGPGGSPGMGKGKGKSPFQQLQELADQQQGINQGMQRMGQGGQQMSEQQRSEMGRMAQQQGRALKALEELEREAREIGGAKKPVGDLNKIAEDMREVISDMQSGSVNQDTRMRQDRILSRLLDASRSINDRDYEKTREARVGQDVKRKSPDGLDYERMQARQRATREQQQQLRNAYTKDYENLIRLYFEALQRQGGVQR
ncbi:MAG: DUF4175 family protein, partial [Candidatus Kapabacteria bacterium]|nr:DUF4175 family protein [Candidatus Kapabacteria bacterium]